MKMNRIELKKIVGTTLNVPSAIQRVDLDRASISVWQPIMMTLSIPGPDSKRISSSNCCGIMKERSVGITGVSSEFVSYSAVVFHVEVFEIVIYVWVILSTLYHPKIRLHS